MSDRGFEDAGLLGRLARAGSSSAAEALFPKNAEGAPDFEQTAIAPRLGRYLVDLPPETRRLILLLFCLIELIPLFLGRFRRFSRLPVETHLRLVQSWRGSSIYPVRVVGESVKAVLSMMYLSHPDALRFMGAYTVSPRPGDGLEVRRERLAVLSEERAR